MNIDEIRYFTLPALKSAKSAYSHNEMGASAYLCQSAETAITELLDALEAKERENKALRNELCFKCGQYREAHNGSCDGCKWRKE